jgi:hypothetical protein
MGKKFKHCTALYESKTARLLLLTQGVRLANEHKAQSSAWKDMIKKRLLPPSQTEDSKPAAVSFSPESLQKPSTEDQPVERNKDVELSSLTLENLEKDFTPMNVRSLLSLVEFISGAAAWIKPNITQIKCMHPYSEVIQAFGLDQEVSKNLADVSDTLTLGRLLRTFQGNFVITPGPHQKRFDNILVRTDSAFMENVILVKGVGPKKRIPIVGIFVYEPSASNTTTTTETSVKTLTDQSVIYVQLPLAFVVSALQETASEINTIFEDSGDDVI